MPATSLTIPETSAGCSFAQPANCEITGLMSLTRSLSAGRTTEPMLIPSSVRPFFRSCKLFAVVAARAANSRSIEPLKVSLPSAPFLLRASMESV